MNKLNKEIEKFAEEQDMCITPHYDRNQYNKKYADREVKYYTIMSEHGVLLGNIQPDCSYEQFLTRIALTAIFRAETLSTLINDIDDLIRRKNKNEECAKENEC